MTNTWVLTPCHRPRLDELRASLRYLNHLTDRTVVITTPPEPIDPYEIPGATVLLASDPSVNISRWWNVGLDWISEHHEVGRYEVLCMHSDVRIEWSTLARLRSVMRGYNLAMVGADRYGVAATAVETRYDLEAWSAEHRIPAECTLIAGELGLRFDEQFHWRYAGDDFEWQHRKAGGTGLVRGVTFVCKSGQARSGEGREHAEIDRERFVAKWGGPPFNDPRRASDDRHPAST